MTNTHRVSKAPQRKRFRAASARGKAPPRFHLCLRLSRSSLQPPPRKSILQHHKKRLLHAQSARCSLNSMAVHSLLPCSAAHGQIPGQLDSRAQQPRAYRGVGAVAIARAWVARDGPLSCQPARRRLHHTADHVQCAWRSRIYFQTAIVVNVFLL